MSYDINFWRQERPLNVTPQEIYEKLCSGEAVEGLAELPVNQILNRLKEEFPDFNPEEDFPLIELKQGSIEPIWSKQHFRFDLRGELCSEHNKLVKIMAEVKCPMYDPQVEKRHDSGNGTEMGELPIFEDQTPEQIAAMEQIKKSFFADMEAKQKKISQTRTLLLTIIIAVAAAIVIWRLFR